MGNKGDLPFGSRKGGITTAALDRLVFNLNLKYPKMHLVGPVAQSV
jgi:hypothetical protein